MTEAELLACSLCVWDRDPRHCRGCNKPLTGRQVSWCSKDCGNWWGINHWWTSARKAAMRRDGNQCVVCAKQPVDVYNAAIAAGVPEKDARRYLKLEVDHIEQVLGRHGVTGCHHHVNGLRTLCAHHHLERHHGVRAEQPPLEAA